MWVDGNLRSDIDHLNLFHSKLERKYVNISCYMLFVTRVGWGRERTIKVWSEVILAWHRFFQMAGHVQIFETYCSET